MLRLGRIDRTAGLLTADLSARAGQLRGRQPLLVAGYGTGCPGAVRGEAEIRLHRRCECCGTRLFTIA